MTASPPTTGIPWKLRRYGTYWSPPVDEMVFCATSLSDAPMCRAGALLATRAAAVRSAFARALGLGLSVLTPVACAPVGTLATNAAVMRAATQPPATSLLTRHSFCPGPVRATWMGQTVARRTEGRMNSRDRTNRVQCLPRRGGTTRDSKVQQFALQQCANDSDENENGGVLMSWNPIRRL